MIRILIADDEKLERRGIRFLLEQREEEMEIFEAPNGKAALEFLQKHAVDILFTDIKMPFMDGIELVSRVRELIPEIEMVIFSGYGEFEYARQAMKAGVENYVLKPVDPKEFHATVDKILGKIEERIRQKQEKENGQNYLERYFFQNYLFSGKEEFLKKINPEVNWQRWGKIRGLLLIESTNRFFEESEDLFIEKITEESSQKMAFLNLGQNQELCILKSSCDQQELARHLCAWINRTFGDQFYIAVSRPVEKVEDIPKIYSELEILMENQFYQKEQRLFLPDKTLEESTDGQFLNRILDRMIEDIELNDITHLWEHYKMLLDSTGDLVRYSQIYTKFMFSNLVKEFFEHNQAGEQKLEDVIQKVYELHNVQEVLELIRSLIENMEHRLEDSKEGTRNEVARAKSYIYEHYSEELSVELLAEKVYLSPGYFSYIFKKETGENVSHFIRGYRMKKSQRIVVQYKYEDRSDLQRNRFFQCVLFLQELPGILRMQPGTVSER